MKQQSDNIVQVACIGDTHLQASHWRNADRLAAFDEAIAAISKLPHLRAIVHMGDVFHTKSTPEDRRDAADRFARMAALAPVVEVDGNHGSPLDTQLQARLQTQHGIQAVTQPKVLQLAGVTLAVLPYPNKGAMVAAGATREAQVQIAHDAFDIMAMEAVAAWQDERGPRMLVGHLTIAGAVTSVGQPLVAAELEMDPLTLARYGDVPKVFGHIHKHQVLDDAVYVGSTCRMDWGETESKGWLLVEFRRDAGTGQWSHTWSLQPLSIPPMYHVEGPITRDVFDWQVRKGPEGPKDDPPAARVPCPACRGVATAPTQTGSLFAAAELDDVTSDPPAVLCGMCNGQGQLVDWTGCDVRVRARYMASERAVVLPGMEARVRAMFPGARVFDFEPVSVATRELRAPEVVAEITLEGKLRAMAKLENAPWSDDAERCLVALLGTEDGDAVAADVATRMEQLAVFDQEQP